MASLVGRHVEDRIARVLEERAARNGRSVEAEHRAILQDVLLGRRRKSFSEALASIPEVGNDEDFARREDETARAVFDRLSGPGG